MLVNNYMLKA